MYQTIAYATSKQQLTEHKKEANMQAAHVFQLAARWLMQSMRAEIRTQAYLELTAHVVSIVLPLCGHPAS